MKAASRKYTLANIHKHNGRYYYIRQNGAKRELFEKTCPSCSKIFYTGRRETITCSDGCRSTYLSSKKSYVPFEIKRTSNNSVVEIFNKSGTKSFLIDNDDLYSVMRYKWTFDKDGYVTTIISTSSGKLNLKLHRYILGASSTDIVDHINNNPSDNRRDNLRLVDKSINALNQKNKLIGIKKLKSGLYALYIKRKKIGEFKTPLEAVNKREEYIEKKAKEYKGK